MDDYQPENITKVIVYHATGATPYPSLVEALADVHQVDRDRLANALAGVVELLQAEVKQPAPGESIPMRMARASQEEIDGLIDFMRKLEELFDSGDESELLDYFFEEAGGVPNWERTVFGFSVLVDNVCDPSISYLDWKPEFKVLLEQPYKGGDA
jgi:hypothetical protein